METLTFIAIAKSHASLTFNWTLIELRKCGRLRLIESQRWWLLQKRDIVEVFWSFFVFSRVFTSPGRNKFGILIFESFKKCNKRKTKTEKPLESEDQHRLDLSRPEKSIICLFCFVRSRLETKQIRIPCVINSNIRLSWVYFDFC